MILVTIPTGKGPAAHGPARLTCNQAAAVLTDVLEYSVVFRPISAEAYQDTLVAHGVTADIGTSLGEMFRAIAVGRDMGRTDVEAVPCSTTLTDWLHQGFLQAEWSARSNA